MVSRTVSPGSQTLALPAICLILYYRVRLYVLDLEPRIRRRSVVLPWIRLLDRRSSGPRDRGGYRHIPVGSPREAAVSETCSPPSAMKIFPHVLASDAIKPAVNARTPFAEIPIGTSSIIYPRPCRLHLLTSRATKVERNEVL